MVGWRRGDPDIRQTEGTKGVGRMASGDITYDFKTWVSMSDHLICLVICAFLSFSPIFSFLDISQVILLF